MTWNTDISEAPKGRTETRKVNVEDKKVTRQFYVPDKLILACRDGKTVTVSQWIPSESRWCFLAKGEEPLAWQAWPEHPEK